MSEKLIDEKLEQFKVALVKNINGVMSRMYEDVMRDVRAEISTLKSELGSVREDNSRMRDEIRVVAIRPVEESGALILKPEMERALVSQVCKKLTAVMIPKITEKVIEQVRGDINDNVIPMINNTLEYIGYATQDGQELITEYRRDVMEDKGPKLLGDARLARNTFGHYQRAFMDDE
jgi:hypothetical protein